MNPIQPRRAGALLSIFVVMLGAASPCDLHAEELAKVDLAEAKAELAKARLLKSEQASEASGLTEVEQSKKPKRKRLFPQRRNSEADQAIKAEDQMPTTPEIEERQSKPRLRLFARKPKGSEAQPPADPLEEKMYSTQSLAQERNAIPSETEPEKNKSTPEPQLDNSVNVSVQETTVVAEGKKPLFGGLFAKKSPQLDLQEEHVLGVEPGAEGLESPTEPKEKKRLFGSIFAKKSPDTAADEQLPVENLADAEQEDTPEVTDEAMAAAGVIEGTNTENKSTLFSIFRKRNSHEYAKAGNKTKLGNSIETSPVPPKNDAGKLGWYVVTDEKVEFYAIGPGQPLPAEKILDRGSMLTVTKGGWGWCNVELGSGELGVVAANAIRPATVAEISRHDRPIASASSSRGSSRLFNILSRGPAPKPELPTSSGDGPIRNFGLLPSIAPNE